MLLRRIGVLAAVIVLLFALGRITSVVVDWAVKFSSIGYVSVFWTAFGRKGRSLCRCRYHLDPVSRGERDLGVAVCEKAAGAASGCVRSLGDRSGVARADGGIVRASAIAIAMAFAHLRPRVPSSDCLSPWARPLGSWDLILRFVYHAPYGGNDPLFDKSNIGFYLFSLPVYVAVKNLLLWILLAGCADGRRNLFPARRYQSGSSRLERFLALGNRPLLGAPRPLFPRR